MSNFQDVVVYFAGLGDACPTLAAVQAALAAAQAPKYAKNGDEVYPGVTVVDVDNGLVHVAAFDAKAPGQRICAFPLIASLEPNSKGAATVDINTADAAGADRGLGMWARVMPVKAQDSAARGYAIDPAADWLPNAWTFGNEFVDWPAVIDHGLNHWQLPK